MWPQRPRVRIPSLTPFFAPVAQLDRASDFESAGRPFEPGRARQVLFAVPNRSCLFSLLNFNTAIDARRSPFFALWPRSGHPTNTVAAESPPTHALPFLRSQSKILAHFAYKQLYPTNMTNLVAYGYAQLPSVTPTILAPNNISYSTSASH